MKKLRTMALVLAAFTAFVVFAGFRSGKPPVPANESVAPDVLVNYRPIAVRCLAVADNKASTYAYATGCTPMDNSTCILTSCPNKKAEKNMKPVLLSCVNDAGQTVAYANSCTPAAEWRCTATTCPDGTNSGSEAEPGDE